MPSRTSADKRFRICRGRDEPRRYSSRSAQPQTGNWFGGTYSYWGGSWAVCVCRNTKKF